MDIAGLRVFVFDELSTADEDLRAQGRRARAAAADLEVSTGGLPSEAAGALAALRGLRSRLERAADALTAAGRALGEVAADARHADRADLLDYANGAFVLTAA